MPVRALTGQILFIDCFYFIGVDAWVLLGLACTGFNRAGKVVVQMTQPMSAKPTARQEQFCKAQEANGVGQGDSIPKPQGPQALGAHSNGFSSVRLGDLGKNGWEWAGFAEGKDGGNPNQDRRVAFYKNRNTNQILKIDQNKSNNGLMVLLLNVEKGHVRDIKLTDSILLDNPANSLRIEQHKTWGKPPGLPDGSGLKPEHMYDGKNGSTATCNAYFGGVDSVSVR